MKIIILLLVSCTIYAKSNYSILEKRHKRAVLLWETGHNKEAYRIFEGNLKRNYAPSIFYIGLYYLYAFNTVKVSPKLAFKYINLSAQKGYVNAVLQRIILYYYGIGIPKDMTSAFDEFAKLEEYIKLFDNNSKSYLLILLGLEKNRNLHIHELRINLLKKLLKKQRRLIRVNLVFFLRTHHRYTRYYRKIKRVIKTEVNCGNSEAQALYYEEYYLNTQRGFKYLLMAGKQGDVNSQYNLYIHYKNKRNYSKKLFWLKKAAFNKSFHAFRVIKNKGF